ncbi:hypothetical protein PROFUN_05165 [Planoprotostelium fungivorum]|uniref:Uncharacterized protein n=1 Tax=Planoprotostelium fungivorum TaxID=1890364 RepID=A0A2P6NRW0_9EUKA|nr:hypothetical protein PROFUN_05165 [Planoprotostelium fungivorum]
MPLIIPDTNNIFLLRAVKNLTPHPVTVDLGTSKVTVDPNTVQQFAAEIPSVNHPIKILFDGQERGVGMQGSDIRIIKDGAFPEPSMLNPPHEYTIFVEDNRVYSAKYHDDHLRV